MQDNQPANFQFLHLETEKLRTFCCTKHGRLNSYKKDGFARAEYIRKKNLFGNIGRNCYYHPFTIPAESKLISMGDNVILAKGVELVTHDMTYALFGNDEELRGDFGDGKYPYYKKGITIGNNVMIGANCLIMPGVTIGSRVVVGGYSSN